MLRRLSSRRSSQTANARPSTRDYLTSKRFMVTPAQSEPSQFPSTSKSNNCNAKKALFAANNAGQSRSRAHSSARAMSEDRDFPTGSSVNKRRRRSRSLEGRLLISTPASTCSTNPTPRSIYRQKKIRGPLKDNRPLKDKEFQQQALAKVRKYFSNYQTANFAPLIVGSGLTLKTFIQLMNILLSELYPNINLTQSNYVEEIPLYMKKLSYPGSVNRSWLVSANTPHSWPYVLGLLHFLVCHLEPRPIQYRADILGDPAITEAFMKEVQEQYAQYECEGAMSTNILPNFQKVLLKKYDEEIREAEIEMQDVLKMEEQLKSLLAKKEKIKDLERQLSEVQLEAQGVCDQISAVDAENCTLMKRTEELEAVMKREVQAIQAIEKRISSLQETVENQALSVADQQRINLEIASNRDYLNSLEKQKEEIQTNNYKLNVESTILRRKLIDAVGRFNTDLMVNCEEPFVKEFTFNIESVEEKNCNYFSSARVKMEEFVKKSKMKEGELKERISAFERQKKEEAVQCEQLSKELAKVSSEIAELDQEHKAKVKKEEKARDVEVKQIDERNAQLEEQVQEAVSAVQALENNMKELQEAIAVIEKDIEYINTDAKVHLNEMDEYYHELVTKSKEVEQEMFARIETRIAEYRASLK